MKGPGAPGVERWVGADASAVAAEGARRFVDAARRAIAERGRFAVALAGGSTPRAMYRLLAEPPLSGEVDWRRVDVFFGDERAVPPDHADSNYRMAHEALLAHVPVDPARVHRMPGEAADLARAARGYEAELRDVLVERGATAPALPRLDLVLLGMGPDGHTASLFPHTEALEARERVVLENHVPRLGAWRLTLTAPAINAAREVVIAVTGADKAPVLHALSQEKSDPMDYPILMVRPTTGSLAWLLDHAAAGA